MRSPDRVQGHLDGLLLGLLAGGPAHGYGLIEALRARSGGEFDLAEGSVYPALHRLEGAGLVTSRWAPGATRRRRVYTLTGPGEQALTAERQAWPRFASAVQAVLRLGPAT